MERVAFAERHVGFQLELWTLADRRGETHYPRQLNFPFHAPT